MCSPSFNVWDCKYFVTNVRNLSPVDDFRAGLLHILSGISSSVRHLGHRSDKLHPRQKYVCFLCSFYLEIVCLLYLLGIDFSMHADVCHVLVVFVMVFARSLLGLEILNLKYSALRSREWMFFVCLFFHLHLCAFCSLHLYSRMWRTWEGQAAVGLCFGPAALSQNPDPHRKLWRWFG